MHVFGITLTVPAGSTASSADAELIRDALWAHASALGEVEHITVTVLPAEIGIAIFLNQVTESQEEVLSAFLRAAGCRSPVLSRWLGTLESEAEFNVSDDPAGGSGHCTGRNPCPGGC